MDGRRFDALTRIISSPRSRRGVLRGTLGASLAMFLSRDAVVAKPSKVTLCHKPGTADQATIEVAESAVGVHLAHGDSLGACPPAVCPYLSFIDPGPPSVAFLDFQDTNCGLVDLFVLQSNNADTVVPPFLPGTVESISVRATKIDQTQVSQVTIRVTNGCGDVDTCDVEF